MFGPSFVCCCMKLKIWLRKIFILLILSLFSLTSVSTLPIYALNFAPGMLARRSWKRLGILLLLFAILFTQVGSVYALTFSAGGAKRDGPGPFAGGVAVQGPIDTTSSPNAGDTITSQTFTQITDDFYDLLDGDQGSIVFWITPEWDGDDGMTHRIITGRSNSRIAIAKDSTGNLRFYDRSQSSILTVDVSSWIAGTTYLVVARWDADNTLNGSHYASISINDVHTYGGTSFGTTYVADGPLQLSYKDALFSPNALIEGLTIYRRPLFDGTYGIDVGNGDEINQIYNSGSGKDPTLVTGSWDVVFALPTNSSTGALATGTGNAWTHPHASNLLYTSTTNTGGFMMNGTYTSDGWATQNGDIQTLTLQPDGTEGVDTYTAIQAPTSNFGIGTNFTTRNLAGASARVTLVKFDLSGIPVGATVEDATLSVWNFTQIATTAGHSWSRILDANADWVEGARQGAQALSGETCWNAFAADGAGGITTPWAGDAGGDGGQDAGSSQSGTDFSATAMGTFTSNNEVVGTEYPSSLDLTEFGLMRSSNNGLVLTTTVNATYTFDSSDSTTAANRPKLVVNYTTPPTVEALATSEKIFAGGYKTTSSAANQGIYYDKTVTAGNDWVVRAIAHSDGTSIPKVILYDQTNGAEIGSLTGTNTSTRTDPDVFIFTGEAPAGMTTLRVKLVNTQSSGTTYWHQVEVLSNRIDNPSVESGSGDPWIPTSWNKNTTGPGTGEFAQGSDAHSGSSSIQAIGVDNCEGASDRYTLNTADAYFSVGGFGKVSVGQFGLAKYGCPNNTIPFQDSSSFSIPFTVDSWTHKAGVVKTPAGQSSSQFNAVSVLGLANESSGFVDDVYIIRLIDVSLTVTPASEANSTENTDEIRVDGRDTYVESGASSIGTGSGFVSFNWRPRHSAADAVKFAETTSDDAYVISFNGDADDYIRVYWDSANTLRMSYSMAGTTGTSTWDATGAIAANTEYAVSLTYTGGGSMVLNIGSADRITLSGIPAAFGIAPNTVYFGSDTSGGNQGDATFSSIVFDNTAPSISLTALSPDPNNDNTPTLTGTATEAIGTVSAVQFQMDSTAGSWSSCTADDGTFDEASETFSCTVSSALSDGSHTMYVRATDSNGNTTAGGSESSDTFTVDATAPTVSVTALSPDPTTDSTPTFSGTATDATTALTAIEFQVDSTAGSWTSCSATDGTIDETSEDYTCTTAALTDGSHTIYVRAADSASNTTASAGYASDTFVVDTGSPTVSLTALSPDPTADTTPTITGSISDTLDIISSVQYQIDSTSGLWTTCTASDGSFDETSESLSCTAGSNLTDGSHTIYVRGTDSAGNVSSNASDTFAVDASAPTAVSLDSPGDGDYVPITYPTFKFHTTTDAVSVISKYTLNITSSAGSVLNIGGDISPTGTDTETTDYRLDYDGSYISVTGKGSSKALSEGTYTWKVTATDAAGNSVSSSRTVYVDLFFPSLDNLDLPGLLDTIDGYGLFSTARPKVTGQLGDLQYPYKLTFTFAKQNFFLGILTGLSTTLIETLNLTRTDNATRINFTYTPSRDLDWGKYQLTITGYDKAGNTASKIYQIQMLPEELALKLISKDETQTPEEKQAKIEEIRETAKVSLPELEKKAILWREKEAEELSRVGSQLADWANTLRRVSDRAVSRGVQLVKAAGNNISKAFADIYQSSQKFIAQIGDVSQGGLARFFMETKNLSFRIWKGISQNANNFLLAADKLARDSLSFAYAAYGNVSGILPQAVKSTGGAVAQVNLFVNQLLADSHNRTKAQILLSQADFKDQLQKWADRGTQAVKTASATVSLANKTASQSLSRSQIKVNGEIRIAQENVRNRWRGLQKGISQAASSVNLELLAAQKDGQEKIGQYHSATSQRIKDAGSALQLALRAAKKPATQTAGFIYRVKVGFATFHSIVFDPAPTRISNVAIDEIGPDYAVVSWDTNHYAYSKVNYAQDLSYGQEVLLPERQKHHTARLTGLASQSRYFFEVMSQNKNYAYDAYYSFETP